MIKKLYTRKIKSNLKDIFKRLLLRYEINNIDKKKRLNENFTEFAIFKDDQISTEINILGNYEGNELNLIFEFLLKNKILSKKNIALDIGANIGNHSIYFSKYFKKIYSFEPNPKAFYLLKFNVSSYKNIKVFNYGLYDKKKTAKIYICKHNIAGSSIKHDKYNHKVIEKINLKKLDNIKLNEKISLIKIDTEGSEFEILKGSNKTINKNKPIILFEQSKNQFKNGTTKSIKFLEKKNYKILYLKKEKYFLFHKKITIIESIKIPEKNHNVLIAVPLSNKSKNK